ncbi:MAG: hypothetical protein ABSA42_20070 [Terracidiphilus sp.]|jgi:hypothetical protein
MPRIYTTTDYEVKYGRFLILSAISGDKCMEVGADVVEGSDKLIQIAARLQDAGDHLKNYDNYWIHEGFIIVNSHDSHDCAETLFAKICEEAYESLTRFVADLNAH